MPADIEGRYLFGVAAHPLPPPPVDPRPLCERLDVIAGDGLAALVGHLPADQLPADGQEDPTWVLARAPVHDQVLAEWVRHGDVVPYRMGALFADQGAVEAHLRAQGVRLRQALAAVAGAVEYRIDLVDTRRGSATSGADYLRARRRQLSGAAPAELTTLAGDIASRHGAQLSVLASDDADRARLACLVPRGSAAALIDELEAVGASEGGPDVVLDGPLPAYHFAAQMTLDDIRDQPGPQAGAGGPWR